jgi:hypothetical protein
MAEARIGMPAAVVRDVLSASASGTSAITDPSHLLSRYISASEQLWEHVDRL